MDDELIETFPVEAGKTYRIEGQLIPAGPWTITEENDDDGTADQGDGLPRP